MLALLVIPALLAAVVLLLVLLLCAGVGGGETSARAGGAERYAGSAKGRAAPTVKLVDITRAMRGDLKRVVTQRRVMRHVGDGKPWTDAKLSRFLKYVDREQRAEGRTADGAEMISKYWAVQADGKIAGVVGIHPLYSDVGKKGGKKEYLLTIFLGEEHQGRGIGTEAEKQALDLFWKVRREPVYADVRVGNKASKASALKAGFKYVKEKKIEGKKYERLRADPPPAP